MKRSTALLVAVVLALAACGDQSDSTEAGDDEPATSGSSVTDEPFDDEPFDDDTIDDEPFDDEPFDDDTVDVDLEATRDDVDCSPEAVGTDFADFTIVHVVVDGVLGAPCLGEEDPTLLQAWDVLAVIAPTLARADIGLFGGYLGDDDSDEVTVAFVNSLDDDGSLFQMSVNLDAFEQDENESYLTMAHEFSHVFTQVPWQLDRTPEAIDDCTTYDNGEGCFFEDSLIFQWIEAFWPDEELADAVAAGEPSVESGEERCDLNPDFLGPYAASDPEEDFAETFSAFVFELDVDPALDDKIAWMADQPGLAEFRDRAIEAGLTPLDNNFDLCG